MGGRSLCRNRFRRPSYHAVSCRVKLRSQPTRNCKSRLPRTVSLENLQRMVENLPLPHFLGQHAALNAFRQLMFAESANASVWQAACLITTRIRPAYVAWLLAG